MAKRKVHRAFVEEVPCPGIMPPTIWMYALCETTGAQTLTSFPGSHRQKIDRVIRYLKEFHCGVDHVL